MKLKKGELLSLSSDSLWLDQLTLGQTLLDQTVANVIFDVLEYDNVIL